MDYSYQIFLLIPIVNFALNFLKKDRGQIDVQYSLNISKLFSIIFLAILIGVSTRGNDKLLSLVSFSDHFNLQFYFGSQSVLIAYAIAVLWIAVIFYAEIIFKARDDKYELTSFLTYLPISIAAITFINFAFTIYAAIFAYSIAIFLFSITFLSNLTEKKSKIALINVILFLFQILILFVILTLANKYSIVPGKDSDLNPLAHSSKKVSLLIFVLFLVSMLINYVNPILFIFRKKVRSESFNILNGFVINFCVAQMLFLKFMAGTFFGIGIFSDLLSGVFMSAVQITFISSIVVSATLLILTKNIVKIFFLILYNLASVAFLMMFVDLFQDGKIGQDIIFTFILLIILFFIAINNLVIYIDKVGQAVSSPGFLFHSKVNLAIVAFCFLSAASLIPPTMLTSIKVISMNNLLHFNTTSLVIIVNSIVVFLVGLKIIISSLQTIEEGGKEVEINNEEKNDFFSQLTLTPSVIIFIIILSVFLI